MSTSYSWEGIRQGHATLLRARHVPERLCGGYVYLGRYIKCSTFTFTFTVTKGNTQNFDLKSPSTFWYWASQTLLIANCGWMVRDSAMVTMGAYRKLPSLFKWYDGWPTTSPSLKMGSRMHPLWYVEFRMAISPQRVIRSTSCFVLG